MRLQCIKEGKSPKDQALIMTLDDLKLIGKGLFLRNDRVALKDRTLEFSIRVLICAYSSPTPDGDVGFG